MRRPCRARRCGGRLVSTGPCPGLVCDARLVRLEMSTGRCDCWYGLWAQPDDRQELAEGTEGNRSQGGEFPYLMARWIGIHSTELLTTPSARLGLELDHLIALTGRNQITLMRTRGHSASGPPHPKGLRLRISSVCNKSRLIKFDAFTFDFMFRGFRGN